MARDRPRPRHVDRRLGLKKKPPGFTRENTMIEVSLLA
jgi:hypothetical protein